MSLSTGLAFLDEAYAGSVTPTLTPDQSRFGNDGTWNTITATQLDSGLWVASLTGAATSYIDVADTGRLDIQTACIWLFPDDITTRSFMDLDGGTHSLEIDGSGDVTATGWSSPTIYINASSADPAVTLSAWKFVVVTTATAFAASDFDIGRESAAYFDGNLALTRLYERALSVGQILTLFDAQRHWFGV